MRKNVRDFDCIREVIEHIYRYGFYSREDFIREGIVGSPRAYDDIIRQLRDLYFLDEEDSSILGTDTRGKYKCYRFKRDYFGDTVDDLTAAFGLFAVKGKAVERILCCLSRAAEGSGATVSNVGTAYYDDEGTDFGPSISRTLKDLSKSGYTVKDKTVHRLNPQLTQLSKTELTSLYYLSAFFAGAGYPRVAAAFLKKTLLREMRSRGLPDPPNAFLLRDNTCGNLFDEQVVYQLLECCSHHVEAELTMIKPEKAGPGKTGGAQN